jgi:hypothetical protein
MFRRPAERSPSPDPIRWVGVGLALVSTLGGLVGSLISGAREVAAMRVQIETLATAYRDSSLEEREGLQHVIEQLSDVEARLRFVEQGKR